MMQISKTREGFIKRTMTRSGMTVGLLALFWAGCCLFSGDGANAREYSGGSFAEEVTIAQQPCKLVGVGMRKKFLVEVYCGALYLQQPTQKADQVIASDQVKRVVPHIAYQQVVAGK
jgi:hypothetical protein